MALKKCKECEHQVSSKADKCPNCGAPVGAKQYGCGTLIGILLLAFLLYMVVSPDPSPRNSTDSTNANSATDGAIDSPPTEPPPPPLKLISFSCEKGDYFVETIGEVKNVSDESLKNIMAVSTLRTSDGTLVTSDETLLDYNPILPGQTSPFKVITSQNPAIESCHISFRSLWGRTIPYSHPDTP